MKTILKYILPFFLLITLMACSSNDDEILVEEPTITVEDINVTVVADQEDPNLLHFELLTPNCLGFFRSEAAEIFMKGVTKFSHMVFYAGDYTLSVQGYNSKGVSEIKTFPFTIAEDHPSVQIKMTEDEMFLAGEDVQKVWVWDAAVEAHYGVGPLDSDYPDWWPVAPYEMEDFEMYDDELTFHFEDNRYQLNAHGFVYVDPTAKDIMGGDGRNIAPYTQPDGQKWTLVYEDDKKYIQFSDGAFPSFVGSPDALGAKYEILELSENVLHLRWPDMEQGQAWYYRFIVKK